MLHGDHHHGAVEGWRAGGRGVWILPRVGAVLLDQGEGGSAGDGRLGKDVQGHVELVGVDGGRGDTGVQRGGGADGDGDGAVPPNGDGVAAWGTRAAGD